ERDVQSREQLKLRPAVLQRATLEVRVRDAAAGLQPEKEIPSSVRRAGAARARVEQVDPTTEVEVGRGRQRNSDLQVAAEGEERPSARDVIIKRRIQLDGWRDREQHLSAGQPAIAVEVVSPVRTDVRPLRLQGSYEQ